MGLGAFSPRDLLARGADLADLAGDAAAGVIEDLTNTASSTV
jgi:hypothetical protein